MCVVVRRAWCMGGWLVAWEPGTFSPPSLSTFPLPPLPPSFFASQHTSASTGQCARGEHWECTHHRGDPRIDTTRAAVSSAEGREAELVRTRSPQKLYVRTMYLGAGGVVGVAGWGGREVWCEYEGRCCCMLCVYVCVWCVVVKWTRRVATGVFCH